MPREILRDRVFFGSGLRFELFYALELLADPKSRIHPRWKADALDVLPHTFHHAFAEIGPAPIIWANFSDVLETAPLDLDVDAIVRRIEGLPLREFQRQTLSGLLHYDRIVDDLLERPRAIAKCLSRIPKVKQEWLAFIGLYPYDADRAEARVLRTILGEPKAFLEAAVEVVTKFWTHAFEATWAELEPKFARSAAEKERLFHACTFGEFARHALLRVEVDDARGVLGAVRGGFELPFERIEFCHFLPSAFNDHRYWTSFHGAGGDTVVYFPYFDPAISIDPLPAARLAPIARPAAAAAPELDAAFIFRALGDSTRFAIVCLLARAPRTSVELAMELSLSKPAISHHIAKLREAGLLVEHPDAGAVRLSLDRGVFERLSSIVIDRLFDNEEPVLLKTSRRKT